MNKIETALYELSEMDELAMRDSPVHSLSPVSKLIATAAYIVTVVSFDKYDLPGIMMMVVWPLILYQLSDTSVALCFHKLRIVLPLVLAVGVFNPIFDRVPALMIGNVTVTSGTISMISLMLKGTECLMASFLLMATTSIDSLCAALRKLRFPQMPVTLLLLTYRYVGVLTEEASVMTDAYHLRAPGQKGVHFSAWGSFLGQLLLRSMDRAQDLYASMQLRGYSGSFHYALMPPFTGRDIVYLAVSLPAFLLMRTGGIAEMIGKMVLR